ncbi:unnamed protein product, partial [Hymenolepis diminuta]
MIGTAKVYCELLPDRTVITLDEFPEYGLLELANYIEDYTVYFAEDCKFPSPNDGDIIVEKSIPLYRFLAGKTKEKVVFAMKGTNYKWISLRREDSTICEWEDSIPETGECANLIVDKVNDLIIYRATFSKTDGKDYDTYIWGRANDVISVTLDWTHTGEAPEVEVCHIQDEQ